MKYELPDYSERRRINEHALVRQLPPGGRITCLVALLMAAATGEE